VCVCVCSPGYDSYMRTAWEYTFWTIFDVNSNLVQSICSTETLTEALTARRIKFKFCNKNLQGVNYQATRHNDHLYSPKKVEKTHKNIIITKIILTISNAEHIDRH